MRGRYGLWLLGLASSGSGPNELGSSNAVFEIQGQVPMEGTRRRATPTNTAPTALSATSPPRTAEGAWDKTRARSCTMAGDEQRHRLRLRYLHSVKVKASLPSRGPPLHCAEAEAWPTGGLHFKQFNSNATKTRPTPFHRSICTNQKCNATSHLGPPRPSSAATHARPGSGYMRGKGDRVAIHLTSGAGPVRPAATVSFAPKLSRARVCREEVRVSSRNGFHVSEVRRVALLT